jgi:5'-3' exonuclease
MSTPEKKITAKKEKAPAVKEKKISAKKEKKVNAEVNAEQVNTAEATVPEKKVRKPRTTAADKSKKTAVAVVVGPGPSASVAGPSVAGPSVAGPSASAGPSATGPIANTSVSEEEIEAETIKLATEAGINIVYTDPIVDDNTTNFVLIDGSYFVFYRYFALNVWWKNAKSGDKPDISCNDDPAFIEKFKKTFESRIAEMNDCLGLASSIKLAAIDCKRADIWRNHIYPDYKLTRTKDDEFGVSKFFKLTYDEKLFEASGVDATLMYKHLEADDCIALTTMHLRATYPDAHIWIIANDHDYLQLQDDHVHLRNLKYQDLTQSKNSSGDSQQDLFCKIVAGDKSDNIRAIFKKCGIKTARKYYQDQDLFEKALAAEPNAEDLYCLNRALVDFNYIPSDLAEGFRTECLLLPPE